MGGLLSAHWSALAERYVQHFVELHITHISYPHQNRIKFYRRYVNNLFFVFAGSKSKAQLFLNLFNKNNPNITFKL